MTLHGVCSTSNGTLCLDHVVFVRVDHTICYIISFIIAVYWTNLTIICCNTIWRHFKTMSFNFLPDLVAIKWHLYYIILRTFNNPTKDVNPLKTNIKLFSIKEKTLYS